MQIQNAGRMVPWSGGLEASVAEWVLLRVKGVTTEACGRVWVLTRFCFTSEAVT